MRSFPTSTALALIFTLALGLAACASPEERAAERVANAQALFDKGDFVKARIEARNALQIEPKNGKARYILAQIAESKGDMSEMLEHLAVVQEVDPKNAKARIKLGTLVFLSQDYDGAAALAREAAALTPDDPELHVLQARLLLQRDESEKGLAELDTAIKLDPKLLDAAMLRGLFLGSKDPEKGLQDLQASIERLGPIDSKPLRQARINLLAQQKRMDLVEQELRSLMADFPQDSIYADRLVELLASQDRLDDAEKVMQQRLANDPTNIVAKVKLAQFQSRYRKNPEEAERSLKKFVADDPDNLDLQGFLGEFYEASGRTAEAVQVYQKVADASPLSEAGLTARNRLAAIDIRANKIDQARERLDGILKDVQDNPTALLARGEINYAAGKYDQAIADLRGILRRIPDSQLGLLLLARTHAANGDPALAEDAYRRLLEVSPGNADGLTELSKLLAADGRLDEAETMLKQVVEANPKNVPSLEILVDIALARNDVDTAEKWARQLVALDDENGVGQRQLGRVLEARKQYPEAVQAYERSLEKNANSAVPFDGVVRVLSRQGKAAEATDFIRAHLERYPDHVLARLSLGGVYLQRGMLTEARQVFTQLVATRPDLIKAQVGVAASYGDDRQGRIEALRRGLAANPQSPELAVLLGTEYSASGQAEEAIKVYEGILKVKPKSAQVANNLAVLLLDYKTDAASHKRALDISQQFANSRSPAYLDTLGWAHYRNKDYDSAIRFLELSVVYGRVQPEARYHLGLAYLGANNAVGAREELEKAIKGANPAAPWLADAKKVLASVPATAPASPAKPAAGGAG